MTSSPTTLAENGSPRVGAPALPGRVQRYQAYQRRSAEYRVKAQELALDKLAYEKYPQLSVDEIKSLVVEDKWLAALSDDRLGIVAGFVDRNPRAEGKDLCNAVAVCHGGRVIAQGTASSRRATWPPTRRRRRRHVRTLRR